MEPNEMHQRLIAVETRQKDDRDRISDHETRLRTVEAMAHKVAAYASLGGVFGGAIATAIAKVFLG